jgi:hypothetical protein
MVGEPGPNTRQCPKIEAALGLTIEDHQRNFNIHYRLKTGNRIQDLKAHLTGRTTYKKRTYAN